ncbi:hypothetical protein [Bradyrhizobium sp. Cp5.3]|uniref:hypothetical protein n=1 Tax=Bradyrhizobium sp. Cp5.3 TaxID=443598 RepID=UPI0004113CB1|nr:hypothetical protein [Bradyrhizobium sp. Cp5.3]
MRPVAVTLTQSVRPATARSCGVRRLHDRGQLPIANGTELRLFSREIMEGGYCAVFSLYAEEAEKNPELRKIYGEWLKFREDIVTWFRVAEASFESRLYNLYKT